MRWRSERLPRSTRSTKKLTAPARRAAVTDSDTQATEGQVMPAGQLEPVIRHLRRAAGEPASPADEELLRRFARHRDEAAFAALVRRHGPLVLGVCRALLRDGAAAEDAFQVTFLLLARKAGALARPELLAPWLHGVARRTAARARADSARRRA